MRHPEHPEFFEEDWLFEAITETYVPLLCMMRRLKDDSVPFRLTMSITPTLCAMLGDPLLQERYVRHLDRTIALAHREIERHERGSEPHALAEFYAQRFGETRRLFVDEWRADLLRVFRSFRDAGLLEIIASAATHGILPLLMDLPQAMRAQVEIGCDVYREIFHADPAGFWLPECAYAPGVEHLLQEQEIRWFILDAHGLLLAETPPRRAVYSPCFTPAGPAAYARDPDSSQQVWSATAGYPGDPAYREFYRDIGFDLPAEYILPGSNDRSPRFSGLKYHRITGRGDEKDWYRREWAENVAAAHAEHFVRTRREQAAAVAEHGFDPVLVMPFDAELFGHWWYEGPLFLEAVIRKTAEEDALCLTTPGEFLDSHPTQQTVSPAPSSWGEGGYWSVWLDERNSWIHPHLHAAGRRMVDAANVHAEGSHSALVERTLAQLARELLLAQSSDWPFLIKTGTARHYAEKRVSHHLDCFNQLHQQLVSGGIDEAFLAECESRDNLFPQVQWRRYV